MGFLDQLNGGKAPTSEDDLGKLMQQGFAQAKSRAGGMRTQPQAGQPGPGGAPPMRQPYNPSQGGNPSQHGGWGFNQPQGGGGRDVPPGGGPQAGVRKQGYGRGQSYQQSGGYAGPRGQGAPTPLSFTDAEKKQAEARMAQFQASGGFAGANANGQQQMLAQPYSAGPGGAGGLQPNGTIGGLPTPPPQTQGAQGGPTDAASGSGGGYGMPDAGAGSPSGPNLTQPYGSQGMPQGGGAPQGGGGAQKTGMPGIAPPGSGGAQQPPNGYGGSI